MISGLPVVVLGCSVLKYHCGALKYHGDVLSYHSGNTPISPIPHPTICAYVRFELEFPGNGFVKNAKISQVWPRNIWWICNTLPNQVYEQIVHLSGETTYGYQL